MHRQAVRVTDMSCGDSELSQSVVSRPQRAGDQWRSRSHAALHSHSVLGLKGRRLPVHARKSFALTIKGRWAGLSVAMVTGKEQQENTPVIQVHNHEASHVLSSIPSCKHDTQ